MGKNSQIDYNDERFQSLERERNAAAKTSDEMYDGMIDKSNSFFKTQAEAVKDYGEQQQQLQQEQTDFTIEQIEQQKEDARKSYEKEQKAAYTDWKRQSDAYGVQAEQEASSGLSHSGYSESSQVAMYNQYQQRLAVARESLGKINQEFDNAITQARLQNSSLLAQIAFDTMQSSAELLLQGFQYENGLLKEKAAAKKEIGAEYYNRFANTEQLILQQQAQAEQIRQFNASLKEEQRQFNANLDFQKKKSELDASASGGNDPTGDDGDYTLVDDDDDPTGLTEEQLKIVRQQVGSNRTVEGKINALKKLYENGDITEEDVTKLLKDFELD